MTIFAERASESKILGKPKFNLAVLPIEDLLHYRGMTVRHAREALNATAQILNALLHNAPAGYPASLRRELRGVMFHVRTALSQLDVYIGAGHYQDDSISQVPDVEVGIYNHLQAIDKAKRQWNIWQALEKQDKKQGVAGMEALTENTTASDATEVGYGYFGYPDLGYEEEDEDSLDGFLDGFLEDALVQFAPKNKNTVWPAVGLAAAGVLALVGMYVWRGAKGK